MKKTTRIVWSILGFLSLGIGMIGAVLPFLPSFPFLMVTLFCFTKSSERLRNWFVGTRVYKNNLESYVQDRTMTRKTKIKIMAMVTAVMTIGFVMMDNVPAARIVLCVVWIFHVLYFVFAIKTRNTAV